MVRRLLLSRVPAVGHPMPAESGDAAAYEALVRARVPRLRHGVPIFDLILLGVGSDGHTASLFPGSAAIGERSRLVVMTEDTRHAPRMTFTYPLINAARRVWILAAGDEKSAIVRECLGTHRPQDAAARYPVLGVRPEDGELVWWLDEKAAPHSRAE
jgi:6-phosphogluconolactonase